MKFAIVVLNGHPALADDYLPLRWGLQQLGHDVTLELKPRFDTSRQTIVLANNFWECGNILPTNTILWNLEWRYSPYMCPEQLEVFQRHTVWDYLVGNINWLRGKGCERTAFLPPAWSPDIETVKRKPVEHQDIDVLLMGSRNERRVEALRDCSRTGLKAAFIQKVYGLERDEIVARAKVILNIHYYPGAYESTRLWWCAANGVPVVSEFTLEPESREQHPFVGWAQLDQLPSLVKKITAEVSTREGMSRIGQERARERPMTLFVEKALDESL